MQSAVMLQVLRQTGEQPRAERSWFAIHSKTKLII